MPQTLTQQWRDDLGLDAGTIHEKWLDLFGNLTLTGYNGELSNSPFREKRLLLADAHFVLDDWISSQDKWGVAEMEERTSILFNRAREIWSRP